MPSTGHRPPALLSRIAGAVLTLGTVAACRTLPTVPISTPEPLEVNLNMRLDIYQYRGDQPENKEEARNLAEAVERQRNRMKEIQTLKDNRLVGENHRGLLQLRETPAGEWGEYVKRTVEAENSDRNIMMRAEARETNRALHEVQTEHWRHRTSQSYKGEYIEIPGKTEGSFEWIQSPGASSSSP
jgi:hypothetical protein